MNFIKILYFFLKMAKGKFFIDFSKFNLLGEELAKTSFGFSGFIILFSRVNNYRDTIRCANYLNLKIILPFVRS